MDLRYSETEEDLRTSLRAMLAQHCRPAEVLTGTESEKPHDPAPSGFSRPEGIGRKVWRVLAVDIGLAGLLVPQEYGGAGAGFREAAVVCEELGRAVAPVPYLGSAVVASAALLACGGAGVDLLGELATGTRTAALAVPLATAPSMVDGSGTVTAEGGMLRGTVGGVGDALGADVLLVPAGDALYAVAATEADVAAVTSLDMTRRLADITLRDAPGRELARGKAARAAVAAGWTAGAALLAAEQVGVAQWCLESTVEYVKGRYQFGRPVGSFQAIKHRLADLWVSLAQARAVARHAAGCLAEGDPDTPVAVALGQAHCGPVAVTAAEECVQMHGGIGFTWEHPAHLYLKRAKADAIAFGTADRHRAALAGLVDLPGASS